jgi:hypothetical protein
MRILVLVEPTILRIHKLLKKTEGRQKIKDGTDGKDNNKNTGPKKELLFSSRHSN